MAKAAKKKAHKASSKKTAGAEKAQKVSAKANKPSPTPQGQRAPAVDRMTVVKTMRVSTFALMRKRQAFAPVPATAQSTGQNQTSFQVSGVLGSGFFCSPSGHFLTAGHCINSLTDLLARHQPGDTYILLNRNMMTGDVTMYDADLVALHSNFDVAVLKEKTGRPFPTGEHIPMTSTLPDIGCPIGTAGYPLGNVQFVPNLLPNGAVNLTINSSGLIERFNEGVASSIYNTVNNGTWVVETDMMFVNGNSGGPIVDMLRGSAFAWVHGYNAQLINVNEVQIPPTVPRQSYPLPSFMNAVQAIYSLGNTTKNCDHLLRSAGVPLNP